MAGVGDISSRILTTNDPKLMELDDSDTNNNAAARQYHNPSYESLEVRDVTCIAGRNYDDITFVKEKFSALTLKPEKVEGFLVRKKSDMQDGAFLVPKIALVATHYPGKQLVDDDGNTGQIDDMYDEACDVGADTIIIYMGLPAAIYPTLKSGVYHPQLETRLFPQQPVLADLAESDCLITLTEGATDFNSDQKRFLRQWLAKPVDKHHAVYERAKELRKAQRKRAASSSASVAVNMGGGGGDVQMQERY